MRDQIEKYTRKLINDRIAIPDSIRFYAIDDELLVSLVDEWRPVFEEVISELNVVGLLLAKPPVPFADLLVSRAQEHETRIYPRDSEVKTFLHDIPFVRKDYLEEDLVENIVRLLRERKGLIIEGVGFVTSGTVTLEQAYIVYSSIFHATYIKYLCDIFEVGFSWPEEEKALLMDLRKNWLVTPGAKDLLFREGPIIERSEILDEMCSIGRYVVQCGLVDSFFGNISYLNDGIIYISQTGSSLDELNGLIDPVPLDNSSTCGITASSELAVHRKIFETTEYKAILHGHPKFSVITSMICDKKGECNVTDCGKHCPETRVINDIPIVCGEIGAGGIAKTVPPAIKEYGRALVFGHGSFCVGRNDFEEAYRDMVDIENICRERYFEILEHKAGAKIGT